MAKGDVVDVVIRTGDGVGTHAIEAKQNGRYIETTLEKELGINWLTVTEMTRGGTVVSRSRFKAEEVLVVRDRRAEKE